MKVLITGASGQLGRALLASAPASLEVIAPDREVLDLADAASIERTLQRLSPHAVINAGAYTAVDEAESEPDLAYAVNGAAPAVLAAHCARTQTRLIQISTDFVFDGSRSTPYPPDAPTRPLNVYGASKVQGEQAVMAVKGLRWHIVRTAWVYATQGRNFMLTMLRLFRERSVVNVVDDQVGTPTSASSLARCVWRVLEDEGSPAIFHHTDAGVASWYDFAIAIYEEAQVLGILEKEVEINPIPTEQYPTPARRPAYSVLDKRSSHARLNLQPTHWRVELRKVLQEIAVD